MELMTKDTSQSIQLNDTVFSADYNEGLVHQAVVAYMNAARSGNAAQKSRSEVRGGGAKPWRQKGTGRARAGTIRSPIWRSGGVTFAAKKRNYAQKINKKMYRAAIKSILSEIARRGHLLILDQFQCATPKTKDFLQQMKDIEVQGALLVVKELGEFEYLASRNVYAFDIIDVTLIDPVSLLKYENIIMTRDAVEAIEEQLK